ncbi:hypothetical protein HRbin20_01737 [bacterium HR20]|nr:hypothetical protein HRbin20_01737 [bacterium HR20]
MRIEQKTPRIETFDHLDAFFECFLDFLVVESVRRGILPAFPID